MRAAISLLSGALFGLGLLISGMVDTRRVQGWLDVFGDWDPTLAFVLGGAIAPMAVAWRIAAARRAPFAGGAFPGPPSQALTKELALGALLFGAGWGAIGLCPGPALAALTFGGWEGALFVAAMLAGLALAPPAQRVAERLTARSATQRP